jgi:hypothetical protein
MLHDLDATLRALLDGELSTENVAISFAAPDDQFPPSSVILPAVDFFLYDIRENTELRDPQWTVEQVGDHFVRSRPPVRVVCSYLITAWPSDSAPDPAADEHQLLGEVMRVLLRHRKLPAAYLQGELTGQEPPLPASIITEARLQSLGELWQAMGGRPKTALHYAVTVSVDVGEPEPAGPVVERAVVEVSRKE